MFKKYMFNIKNMEKEKCILMGDFNVTPENDVLKPIRACMKDTADYFDKPLLSFPSDKPIKKIFLATMRRKNVSLSCVQLIRRAPFIFDKHYMRPHSE